jgi:hypothetical protein
MNIRRIGIGSLLSVVALNAWAGGGGAPANANAKASYDATGTWTAKVEGGRGPAMTMVFVLKQEGDTITGTVSTNGGPPVEISEGKAGSSAVHFAVSVTMPPMQMPGQPADPNAKPTKMVTRYTGKISGNDMELTRQMQMPGGTGGMPPMGGGGGGMGGGMRGGGGMPMGGGGGGMPMGGGGGGMPMGGADAGGGMPMSGGPGGPGGMNAPITAHRGN